MRIRYWLGRMFAHMDWPLLGLLLALLALSTVVVFSASGGGSRMVAHFVNMGVALGVMLAASLIPPQRLMQFALPLYALGIVLLLGVALFGDVVNGARRWLNLGVTRIQPSELMRLAVPMMLAWYLHTRQEVLAGRDFIAAAALLLLPLGFILKQPDLGTSLLIASSGFFVLFLGGLSWRVIAAAGIGLAAFLPIAWEYFLHDYQRRRVLTMLDPSSDPLGAGYHIIQSTIAVGSGGIVGKGWLAGTQAHLDFLPERATDFIFAVYAEEFGLLGGLFLLLLYAAIIWRGLQLAAGAPTLFGRLLSAAIVLTFFTYAFVNMGMVSGILPVVGVPLPLVSYGGTSMVTVLLGFGMVMSVATHKKLVKT